MTDARTLLILDRCSVPRDLSGKTVLDVGCKTGDFSLECAQRGAAYVLGIDVDKSALDVARSRKVSNVEFSELSVYDVEGEYDIVLFFGVLYHLRHPLLAIEKLHKVTREVCYVETHTYATHDPRPISSFRVDEYASSFETDSTNWFSPSRSCVEAWFRACEFDIEYLSSWDHRATFRVTPRNE